MSIEDRSVAKKERRVSQSKHGMRARLLVMLTALDGLAIAAGLMAVAWLYLGSVLHDRLMTFLPILLLVYYPIAIRQRAYQLNVVITATRSTRRAFLSLSTSVLVVISIVFLVKTSEEFSRLLATLGSATSGILIVMGRFFFARIAFMALNGSPENEIVLVDGLAPPAACTAYKIDLQAAEIEPDINDPVMLDKIGSLIHEADRVIVCCPLERRAAWSLALKGAGVNVEVLAPELDAIGVINATSYHGTATALVASGPLNAADRLLKRIFDLSIAIIAVVILSPFFLLIGVLIKLESPGSVFFVQQRIGRGNRMFPMYKFRSMRSNVLDHEASKLTTRNDPRVTRIGKIIRKTSVDELPQLINVLLGDMSIVGPRPHAAGALAGDALYWEVSSQYWSRHAVKPGLTGLAQVRGFRGNTETGDDLLNRLQSDLTYLNAWTIWRDITLVAKTFGVLMHRNAF